MLGVIGVLLLSGKFVHYIISDCRKLRSIALGYSQMVECLYQIIFKLVSWFTHTQHDALVVLFSFFPSPLTLDISLTQVAMDFPKNLGVTPKF